MTHLIGESMNQSIEFLNAVDSVWRQDVPAPVMARAKRSLLDYLAVTCAGAAFQREKLEKYMAFALPEPGSFRAIGYSLAVSGHEHTEIPGSYSAKMSIPYATSAGLMYGKAGLQEFSEEAVQEESILALTRKIHVEADEALSAAFPREQTAIVTIRTKDGEFTDRVDFPKGEPENPLTDEEFRVRYDGLMDYAGVNRTVSGSVFDFAYQPSVLAANLVKAL